eukprot:GILK01005729.1.p1 GENE.GILK01005729.1~~GILK01005729.1.p1  ORF type:complete len:1755 (-),score=280.80 GILK01005729.1:102-5366(-)
MSEKPRRWQRFDSKSIRLGEDDALFRVHGRAYKYTRYSLGLLSSESKIRLGIVWFAEWSWFQFFNFMAIVVNSVFLGLYDYKDTDDISARNQVVSASEPVFTAIFTFECVVKVLAAGFVMHKNAYLRDRWNWLDFVVVVTGLVSSIAKTKSVSFLRTFRVFRPLKNLTSFRTLRKVLKTLFSSLSNLGNVAALVLFVFFIWGILGVDLYMGKTHFRCRTTATPDSFGVWPVDPNNTYACTTSDGSNVCPDWQVCGSNYEPPVGYVSVLDDVNALNPTMMNGLLHFDNLGRGFMVLFQAMTVQDWSDILYMYQDIMAPWFSALYFILFILTANSLGLNLALAVLYDCFERSQQKNRAAGIPEIASPSQVISPRLTSHHSGSSSRSFRLRTQRTTRISRYSSRNSSEMSWSDAPFVRFCHRTVVHPKFSLFIMVNIIVNTIILSLDRYPAPPDDFTQAADALNVYFTTLFGLEMALKWISFGVRRYYRSRDNTLDSVIVIFSIVEICVQTASGGGTGSSGLSALRSFRLLRVVKLVKNVESLRQVLTAVQKTMGILKDFAVLLFILMYVFALLGMSLFAGKLNFPGEEQTRYHFDDLLRAFTTTFQIFTDEDWDVAWRAALRADFAAANIFFIGYIISCRFIMLELFIVVLISSFIECKKSAKRMAELMSEKSVSLWHNSNLDSSSFNSDEDSDPLSGSDSEPIRSIPVSPAPKVYEPITERDAGSEMEHESTPTHSSLPVPVQAQPSPDLTSIPISLQVAVQALSESIAESRAAAAAAAASLDSTVNKEVDSKIASSPTPPGYEIHVSRSASRKVLDLTIDPNSEPSTSKSASRSSSTQNLVFVNESTVVRRTSSHAVPTLRLSELKADSTPYEAVGAPEIPGSLPESSCKQPMPTAIESLATRILHASSSSSSQAKPLTVKQPSQRFWKNGNNSVAPFCIVSPQDVSGSEVKSGLADGEIVIYRPEYAFEKSCFCVSKQSRFYRLVHRLVNWSYFERLILTLILVNCVMMAVDNPLDDPESDLQQGLLTFNIISTSIFVVEMVCKMIAFGVFTGEKPYLRNGWDIMDCFVVVISLVDVSVTDVKLSFVKALRALRVLRPLRLLNRNPGLKLVINTLGRCIPAVASIMLVVFVFFVMYGILGVSFFKGLYQYCDTSGPLFSGVNGTTYGMVTSADCISANGEWKTYPANFDNILWALFSLFEMITLEDWMAILYHGVDGVGPDMMPVTDYNTGRVFYFIVYVVVARFFLLNMFVGSVIDSFQSLKREMNGQSLFMTPEQKKWVQISKAFINHPHSEKPVMKGAVTALRKRLYTWLTPRFELFITVCICLNNVILAMYYYQMPAEYSLTLEILNSIFAVIYTAEVILKLYVYRIEYFRDNWNKFDFLVVLGSDVFLILSFVDSSYTALAKVARVFRLLRTMKLLNTAKSFRTLFLTFISSLPSLANIGILLFLFIYIYAVLGVNLFSTVMYRDNLNRHANFRSFGSALQTMFRCATGEGWDDIMTDLMLQDSYQGVPCTSDVSYTDIAAGNINGCGSYVAIPFFFSYTILVTFVMFNLFVAVVIEAFADEKADEESNTIARSVQCFINEWSKVDKYGTRFISPFTLALVLKKVPPPLGFKPRKGETALTTSPILKIISNFNLPLYNHQLHFKDVCQALAERFAGGIDLSGNAQKMMQQLDKQWQHKFPELRSLAVSPRQELKDFLASRVILKFVLKYRQRRNKERLLKQASSSLSNESTGTNGSSNGKGQGDSSPN